MARPLRLLVVEDNENDYALVIREVRKGGYEPISERVDTAEALNEALARQPWDIIVSDWSMPHFSGLSAYQAVREHGLDIPFIIVSGTIGEDIAVDALKAGAHDFITKGMFARLLPAIERELREADVRRRQRQADAELERHRREIEQSEQLLRVVLESVPDGVAVVDERGKFILWNPAADALVHMSHTGDASELWSGSHGMYRPDKVTPFPVDELALAQALRGKPIDRQEQFVRHEGRVEGAWLSVNARPFQDETTAIKGAVAVYRDISQDKATQEQLMISDRMASIGMLAAAVGHEINNPLAAVLANLDLVHRALETRVSATTELADVKEMIDDARDAADRVRHIVRDLRILSRHDEAQREAVDVQRVLESSLRIAWNEIRHRARLIKEYGTTTPVFGSESRLGQVFLNLIVNAAQAIPEGSVETNAIRIRTEVDSNGNVVVEVADTGPGMSPEVVANIFTPFFTTKPAGIGTGLGLAICHRIINNLGGSITVESELGHGTTFRVTLPAASEAEVREQVQPVMTAAPAKRQARILVVDDEPVIGTIITRILDQHDVKTTTQAAEALARIRAGDEFDVILCDLMMPQMTGMELHAELTTDGLGHADRIIFLTGGAFTTAARTFLNNVSNQRVEKPFDTQFLKALVNDRVR